MKANKIQQINKTGLEATFFTFSQILNKEDKYRNKKLVIKDLNHLVYK